MNSFIFAIRYEWWLLAVSAGIVLLGFLKLRREEAGLVERLTFAQSFRDKFIEYANSQGRADGVYRWLISNSNRMQRELGVIGFFHTFHEPGRGTYRNYPIILNLIPKLRGMFADERTELFGHNSIHLSQIDECVHYVDNALLRYLGDLSQWEERRSGNLFNPIDCFRVGMEQVIAGPLHLLRSFGLLSAAILDRVKTSGVFRFISGAISLVGFVGLVIGLIVDFPQALPTVREWVVSLLSLGSR